MDKIEENIDYMISQKRSVLLICYSKQEGKEFLGILVDKYGKKMLCNILPKMISLLQRKRLKNQKLQQQTNLARRGTNIKISDELESNGGPHVLVSFLALNQRIEDKNYGRAGRKGQRGSYTLIMQYNDEYGPLSDDNLKLKIIKEKGKKPNMKGLKINQK